MHGKPLAAQLEELVLNSQISEERLDILLAGIKRLAGSDVLDSALRAADLAPDFTLFDQFGKSHSLSAYLAGGPVLLQFFRGDWCPFCRTQLRALSAQREHLAAQGSTLLCISPESADRHLQMQLREDLQLTLLSDPGGQVAQSYGVAYDLSATELSVYRELGVEPTAAQPGGQEFLPIPASYIIEPAGRIRFAFVEPDFRKRSEPQDLLAELMQLRREVQS